LAPENQSTPFVTPTKLIDTASATCFDTIQVCHLQGEQSDSFIKLLFVGSWSVAAPECGAQVPKHGADAPVMLY
jgi:hypothetical protein